MNYVCGSAVGFPIQLPWMPYDEQFNETKTFGFVGDELRAGINQVCCLSLLGLLLLLLLYTFQP